MFKKGSRKFSVISKCKKHTSRGPLFIKKKEDKETKKCKRSYEQNCDVNYPAYEVILKILGSAEKDTARSLHFIRTVRYV